MVQYDSDNYICNSINHSAFFMIHHKFAFTFVIVLCFFSSLRAQEPAPVNSGELQLSLDKMNTLGTVLYIAAHPDDENTRLLSYLANDRKFRTIYLSLTRGDGGQNLIGKEQGSELGMIRTRELLAARSVDRAEQYFTRANDFGFSKNPEETFTIWPREEILSDVVWAIRYFKPDVIINRFPTTGEGGHGHHTASALLSLEAFKAAADPLRFPDQLKYVEVWKAKRVFLNSFVPRGQVQPEYDGQLKLDVGGYNPLLGNSYGEIAAKSRSMHKSQGFGVPRGRGTQIEYFRKQAGDTIVTEIFEGVDSTWNRVKGSDEIEKIFQQASSTFDAHHPEKVIPLLVKALKKIKTLENSYWKNYKIKELEKLIAACAGLWFEVNPKDYYATPGDSMEFTVTGISRLQTGVKFNKISFAGFDSTLSKEFIKNEPFYLQKKIVIPLNANYTNPFWLRQQHDHGFYNIKDLTLRGEPWNTDGLNAIFQFTIDGEEISYTVPISYKWT
ncbi:MAG TPA: PIG-L family deacetylase, partial [Bacteroidia bacterium]|nr:PIG-L family deacetylase [Bacteroidia bacterium]